MFMWPQFGYISNKLSHVPDLGCLSESVLRSMIVNNLAIITLNCQCLVIISITTYTWEYLDQSTVS